MWHNLGIIQTVQNMEDSWCKDLSDMVGKASLTTGQSWVIHFHQEIFLAWRWCGGVWLQCIGLIYLNACLGNSLKLCCYSAWIYDVKYVFPEKISSGMQVGSLWTCSIWISKRILGAHVLLSNKLKGRKGYVAYYCGQTIALNYIF